MTNRRVEFIVPAGVDDQRRPSGGNVYDRRLADELPRFGWTVREHPLERDRLAGVLAGLPDEAVVLVDGLIASASPELVEVADRLRVIALVHMPFAEADPAVEPLEAAVLHAATALITTSEWSRDWIATNLRVPVERIRVATPGVDRAALAQPSHTGRQLLCVGPVTPAKGHDVLVEALAQLTDLDWHCMCVGALDLDPDFVLSLRAAVGRAGLVERLSFTGPLATPALDEVRARTDLLVSASRRESYGMVAAEALVAGIPVVATDVGGQAEAVGMSSDGTRPGVLVPDGDATTLVETLRRWLTEPNLRERWRASAGLRRQDLADWSDTARAVAAALVSVADEPRPRPPAI